MDLLEEYNIKEYTIFGSDDSSDIDVMFYIDSLPDMQISRKIAIEAESLVISDKEIDVNLCCVENGIVVSSLKGSIDEVNNMMLYTRQLHKQPYAKRIYTCVERDVDKKVARALRGLLSFISRTSHRTLVKSALRGTARDKINALRTIALSDIHELGKDKLTIQDFYKLFSFQLGQCIPLISSGIELYTKKSIVGIIPEFEPYLYRKSDTFPDIDLYKHQFLDIVESKMDLNKIIE